MRHTQGLSPWCSNRVRSRVAADGAQLSGREADLDLGDEGLPYGWRKRGAISEVEFKSLLQVGRGFLHCSSLGGHLDLEAVGYIRVALASDDGRQRPGHGRGCHERRIPDLPAMGLVCGEAACRTTDVSQLAERAGRSPGRLAPVMVRSTGRAPSTGFRSSTPGRSCPSPSARVRFDLKRAADLGPIVRVRPPPFAPVVITVVVRHLVHHARSTKGRGVNPGKR